MKLQIVHPPVPDPSANQLGHTLVQLHEPPVNTSEGGEFLDDAIHMDELPVILTEESVSAGSPRYLL
ncbi:hypothetical protein [Paraflavitalea pollutisoli]|uniref:hypothetical protein n=1 Tax=Paraflavitalea pollutisoli TaxID=3034143 RepID=UPI0023EE11BE|nr:hypothetical protein [Paraflavitalea sp. H1-2-19X]